MKRILRLFLWLILIVLILGIGYFVYIKFFVKLNRVSALNAIPHDAFAIVQTDDLFRAYKQVTSTKLWKDLLKTQYFADIAQDLEQVDKYLRSTKLPENFFKNRQLLVSVHTIGNTWDMLYVADLKDLAKLMGQLQTVFTNIPGYKTFKINFTTPSGKAYLIYKLVNLKNQYEKLYLTIADNLLIFSYNLNLVKQSLNGLDDNHWQQDSSFQAISRLSSGRQLFTVYANFHYLDDFVLTFQKKLDPWIEMLSNSLNYAIFTLEIRDNLLTLDGSVGVDSQATYLSTLVRSQPSVLSSYQVMSEQTAAMITLNFKDYAQFYEQLLQNYRATNPQQAQSIDKDLKLLKKLFGFDPKTDLFPWIGDEIAVYKLTPSSEQRMQDVAIAFHPLDFELARQSLLDLTKKIKRITPLKFKQVNYRGYDIYYLKVSGLFNLLLGKMMSQFDKPYFTFIDQYVVFSNSPMLLEKIIDDYTDGFVLSKDRQFRDFLAEFRAKANFTALILTPNLYKTLYYYAPAEDKAFLRENKQLILGFAMAGLQLISQNDRFKITFKTIYSPDIQTQLMIRQFERQIEVERLLNQLDSLKFKITLNDSLADYTGPFKAFYPNSDVPLMEGYIKQGKPVGLWRTYYPSGNLQTTQIFDQDGRLSGIVQFFYDDRINSRLAEVTVDQDVIDGTLVEYYPDGSIKLQIEYKDGLKHGKAIFYYPSGQVKIKGHYRNGKKDGKWVFYDKQGNVLAKEVWRKGQRVR